MIIYYIQYLVVSLISFLSVFKQKNTLKIAAIVFVILFSLVAFRDKNIDRDYNVYLQYFNLLSGDNVNYFKEKILVYEPSNYFIPLFFKLILGNKYFIHFSFITFAFLGVFLKLKSLKLSNSFFLSILLYLTNFYLLHEMTQIRAGVATGLFLISLPYLYERKQYKYMLIISMACFFHYSSILFFPLYFIIKPNTLNKKFWLTILTIVSIISLTGNDLLNPKILSFIPKIKIYVELMSQGEHDIINIWNNPGFLINIFMTYLLLFKAKLIILKNKYFIILLKINIMSIIIYMGCSSIPPLAIRASQLIGVVQIILFPCIIFCFKEKVIPYTLILFISLTYFYNHYIRVDLLQPYQSWLFS